MADPMRHLDPAIASNRAPEPFPDDPRDARIDQLEAALKPFARHIGKIGAPVTLAIGADTWAGTLTAADFARAHDTLWPQPHPR